MSATAGSMGAAQGCDDLKPWLFQQATLPPWLTGSRLMVHSIAGCGKSGHQAREHPPRWQQEATAEDLRFWLL